MQTVQIYVNDIRLDLFQDEKIEVTSTIQNVKDISKVFTDFSQTFTVPASKVNNGVFSHYYNNDVNGTFIAKERAPARIELNHTPFRVGKVQLEGAEIVNNQAESYRITFFGDVVTLKDKFGDDKLSDLDYSSIQVEYKGPNIKTAITTTSDVDVRYPLISSDRIWQYGSADSNDISLNTSPIVFDELFPALKVSKVFEFIQNKYNLTFTGNFLSDKRFTNLFTFWKNRKETNFSLEPVQITFDNPTEDIFTNNEVVISKIETGDITPPVGEEVFNVSNQKAFLYLSCDDVGKSFSIQVFYRNEGNSTSTPMGTYDFTVTTAGYQGYVDLGLILNSYINFNRYFSYKIFSQDEVTIYDVDIRHRVAYQTRPIGMSTPVTYRELDTWCDVANVDNPFVLNPYLDFSFTAPEMTISDYFSGILSEFNLTCFPLQDGSTFQIEPLDVWYRFGGELDITPYTIIDSITVDRPKLHKSISFEWEKSKSFLNEQFEEVFTRQYGSLSEVFPYDGSQLKIKIPFENLLFNRFTDTNLQVAYSTTEANAGKSYVPKVTNLYLDESKTCSFYFNDGASTTEITSYVPLGQDLVYNTENYSSNFGLDISTLKNESVNNSLYQTYYAPYLENLFNDKTREVTVECQLPLSKLTLLTLDDAIILRDKKYRINEMKTDITTGKVKLVLLSDWIQGAVTPPFTFDPLPFDAEDIVTPVKPIKPKHPNKPYKGGGGYVTYGLPLETSFISGTPSLPATFTEEGSLIISVTENNTGAFRTNTIPVTYYNPDGTVITTEYIYINQDYEKSYLLTEDGGYILTETYDRIIL